MTDSYEENRTKGQLLPVYCSKCYRDTQHRVISSYESNGSSEDDGEDWGSSSQIIQCQGCLEVSFRRVNSYSGWWQQVSENECDPGDQIILYGYATIFL